MNNENLEEANILLNKWCKDISDYIPGLMQNILEDNWITLHKQFHKSPIFLDYPYKWITSGNEGSITKNIYVSKLILDENKDRLPDWKERDVRHWKQFLPEKPPKIVYDVEIVFDEENINLDVDNLKKFLVENKYCNLGDISSETNKGFPSEDENYTYYTVYRGPASEFKKIREDMHKNKVSGYVEKGLYKFKIFPITYDIYHTEIMSNSYVWHPEFSAIVFDYELKDEEFREKMGKLVKTLLSPEILKPTEKLINKIADYRKLYSK